MRFGSSFINIADPESENPSTLSGTDYNLNEEPLSLPEMPSQVQATRP
jgi:hypothetical protein